MKRFLVIMIIQCVYIFSTQGMETTNHAVEYESRDLVIYQDLPVIFQNFKNRLLENSFQSQKKECQLYDFSDPFGVCFLGHQNLKITRPLLFPIMKDGKEGFLLGTYHLLPADLFMEKAMDCFSSCKSLVVEYMETSPTKESLQKCGLITQNNQEDSWWLHDLSNPIKNYLLWYMEHACTTRKRADIIPLELTPMGAFGVYASSHQDKGMEGQLEQIVGGEPHGLEIMEESAPKMFDVMSPLELEDKIENYFSHGNITKELLINDPIQIEAYCYNAKLSLPEEYWKSELDRESGLTQRNYMWLPRIDTHFQELERPLFAVGTLHLFGPYGLLTLLQERGYTIGNCEDYWEE